jgi:hypothetical protein
MTGGQATFLRKTRITETNPVGNESRFPMLEILY